MQAPPGVANANKNLPLPLIAVAMMQALLAAPAVYAIDFWLSPQGELDVNLFPIIFPVNHHAEHGFPYSSGQTNIWFGNRDDDPEDDGGIHGRGFCVQKPAWNSALERDR